MINFIIRSEISRLIGESGCSSWTHQSFLIEYNTVLRLRIDKETWQKFEWNNFVF